MSRQWCAADGRAEQAPSAAKPLEYCSGRCVGQTRTCNATVAWPSDAPATPTSALPSPTGPAPVLPAGPCGCAAAPAVCAPPVAATGGADAGPALATPATLPPSKKSIGAACALDPGRAAGSGSDAAGAAEGAPGLLTLLAARSRPCAAALLLVARCALPGRCEADTEPPAPAASPLLLAADGCCCRDNAVGCGGRLAALPPATTVAPPVTKGETCSAGPVALATARTGGAEDDADKPPAERCSTPA